MEKNLKPLYQNKENHRYYFCEDDEPLCSKYIKSLDPLEANKRLLPFYKRIVIPQIVKLSPIDRASQLRVDEECTRVTGEKGYCMVRATHGINRGKFYFEVHIDSMTENTATRIGWGQHYANLQAPLGYDFYGYSWRSRFGTKFHQARGKTFDEDGGYREKDTLGCMIELPFGNSKNETQAHHLPISMKQIGALVAPKKRDQSPKVYEEEIKPPHLSSMKTLHGSKISYYKNGKLVGVAFEDISAGWYYPSISLYKSCTVTTNFGPEFKYPPEKFNEDNKNHLFYRPAQDMAEISIIDNLLSDLLYIIDMEITSNDENKLDGMIATAVRQNAPVKT